MPALCNVEGRLSPPEEAVVPVLDRGFLYGDSVYEVVRTYRGRPFELERHLDRPRRKVRPGPAQRSWTEPPDHPGPPAGTSGTGAVRTRPADGGGQDAPQPSPGTRSGAENRQLSQQYPRHARGARCRLRRR